MESVCQEAEPHSKGAEHTEREIPSEIIPCSFSMSHLVPSKLVLGLTVDRQLLPTSAKQNFPSAIIQKLHFFLEKGVSFYQCKKIHHTENKTYIMTIPKYISSSRCLNVLH